MADERAFTAFNFSVEIKVPNVPGLGTTLCSAAFSECDGLEVTMEAKSFRQGGLNTEQIHLAGGVTYSNLTLKRGMSKDFGLWRWFQAVMKSNQRSLRGQATIVMLGIDRRPQVTFKVKDCMPVKLRAPALNATDGAIAIEEMQLVYAAFEIEFPK